MADVIVSPPPIGGSNWRNAIQNAVNSAIVGDIVRVPAVNKGNWVNPTDSWQELTVPAGISVIGATSPRDAKGFNTNFFTNRMSGDWATSFVMPIDAPQWSRWITINGTMNPAQRTRLSELKLIGYRTAHPTSITRHYAVQVVGAINFRVDHMMMEHCCGGAVSAEWYDGQNRYSSGLIDHTKMVNEHGYDLLVDPNDQSTVNYGISVSQTLHAPYEDPITNFLGKYTNSTWYIEDCYFSRWRHITQGHGGWYVLRHCTFDGDWGHYTVDTHGQRDGAGYAGGRGCEVYENTFINCDPTDDYGPPYGYDGRGLAQFEGGTVVWFNNYVDSSYNYLVVYPTSAVPDPTWDAKNCYFWGAKGPWGQLTSNGGIGGTYNNVNFLWARSAGTEGDLNYPNVDPSWAIAGYKPYTYPHPMTSEDGGNPVTSHPLTLQSNPSAGNFTLRRIA